MNPTHLIATGFAATACAVAIALHLSRSNDNANGKTADPTAGRQTARPHARPAANTTRATPSAQRSNAPSNPLTDRAPAPRITHHLQGQSPPHGSPLSALEWRAKAAQVEQDANRELARLAALLHLDADQQQHIFAILARNSAAWQPGMRTAMEPAPADGNLSEIDQLLRYLDADQQETLLREEMDRLAWWEEVLPQLLPPDTPEPETKAFDGPESLEDP